MKAAGYLETGVALDNPDFAAMANAIGIKAQRVEDPGDLEEAARVILAHDGPALLDVVTARNELSMPPKMQAEQVKGFSLYVLRATRSSISPRSTSSADKQGGPDSSGELTCSDVGAGLSSSSFESGGSSFICCRAGERQSPATIAWDNGRVVASTGESSDLSIRPKDKARNGRSCGLLGGLVDAPGSRLTAGS